MSLILPFGGRTYAPAVGFTWLLDDGFTGYTVGTDLNADASWQAVNGNHNVKTSSELRVMANDTIEMFGDNYALYTGTRNDVSLNADMRVKVNVVPGGGGARSGAVAQARCDITAATSYDLFWDTIAPTTLNLRKWTSAYVSTTPTTFTISDPGFTFELDIEVTTVGGNAFIEAFINDVSVGSYTDSSTPLLSGNRAGFMSYSGNSGAVPGLVAIDRIRAGNL